MQLSFSKYQGTGNDFILIDNRNGVFPKLDATARQTLIARLCHRRFGIGADGLMLLQSHDLYNFEMIYFNADGNPSSMCGNGGRCIMAFAHRLGVVGREAKFLAVDGEHAAYIDASGAVSLQMQDVASYQLVDTQCILNTGSPHFVQFVDNVAQIDVAAQGRTIRNSDAFRAEGINVNFVQPKDNQLLVATYERGVEDETWSCGTGVTAAALAHHLRTQATSPVAIATKGGNLSVSFEFANGSFTNIWLSGGAEFIFEGTITVTE